MAYNWVDSEDQPKVRYKARFGPNGDVSTTGGASLPDGFVIVTAQNDNKNHVFRAWVYPALPNGEDVLTISYNAISVESAPPDGWRVGGTSYGFDPTKTTAVLHEIAKNTYRLKLLFSSWRGDNNPWDLCLCDTGWNLVRS